MAETAVFQRAAQYIQDKLQVKPEIGLILGSGLGDLAEEMGDAVTIPYEEIPGFLRSTVAGHKGRMVIGDLVGRSCLAMQGRFHYYEGYDLKQVTLPVRVMKELGIKQLIVTNAAGGINLNFAPGDLMVIVDHINLMGSNPLIGPNIEGQGPRFPDLSQAYSLRLQELAFRIAAELNMTLRKGVYIGVSGPSYETPAEIRMFRTLGADAVGMSTVPEVIVAAHCGMEVLGISCISNMAAGILDQPLSHEEVMETAERVKEKFTKLIKGIIGQL
jgi:purine-nucleoside phosphorylase